MTDADLVAKKAGLIEAYIHELRSLAHPQDLRSDVREQRFILHTLQMAVQAALDIASHIVSDDSLGEPRTNRELFALLARHGWVDDDLQGRLADMAGFHNVLVHGYSDVDLDVVEDVLATRLDDLIEFVGAVRARLP